jgi:uncharacterized membrane protein
MSVTAGALTAAGPLIILFATWLTPSLTPPTVPFGVRVPPNRIDADVISEQRRWFRWVVGVGGGAAVTAGVTFAVVIRAGRPLTTLVLTFVLIGVGLASYLRAHGRIQAAKIREHWYEGLREGVSVDTSLRTEPVTFPWLWAAPAIGVILGTMALAVIRYPHLPPRIILHVDAAGRPDQTVATSVLAVAGPIFTQVVVTAALMFAVWLSLRARADLDPAQPTTSADRHRAFAGRMSRGLLVLTALVDLSFFGLGWQIWSANTSISVWPVIAPVFAGVAVLFAVIIRTGQLGVRVPAAGGENPTGVVHRDDDRYWRGGLIYINRRDPAVFVPKRFGVGWTMNLGNPWAVVVFVAIVILAASGGVLRLLHLR